MTGCCWVKLISFGCLMGINPSLNAVNGSMAIFAAKLICLNSRQ